MQKTENQEERNREFNDDFKNAFGESIKRFACETTLLMAHQVHRKSISVIFCTTRNSHRQKSGRVGSSGNDWVILTEEVGLCWVINESGINIFKHSIMLFLSHLRNINEIKMLCHCKTLLYALLYPRCYCHRHRLSILWGWKEIQNQVALFLIKSLFRLFIFIDGSLSHSPHTLHTESQPICETYKKFLES